MKVVIVSLNAKYIHTNLAIRYLEAYCKNIEDIHSKIREFTINDQLEGILRELYKEKADVIAFSCYIWNIEESIKIVQMLKSVQPHLKIILGGPEVTFYGEQWMRKVKEIDFIVKGEGEFIFYELLKQLKADAKSIDTIKGILYRGEENVLETPDRILVDNLSQIPFPYQKDLSSYQNKILYFESSRGCPFRCQYCLSSTTKGVRFFPMERVKKQLKSFIEAGVKQVKFVDRTFNCDKHRTKELLEYLINQEGQTNFHFEVAADLLDQELLDILQMAPIGLFQLEIGVQSTHPSTLKAIERINDFQRISNVVKTIQSFENIHQHIDLIAGLPYEDYNTFKKSFNEVFYLQPDMLQLGFLKILKGSGIELNQKKYGYQHTPFPPYEVLSNNYISYGEIIRLKFIEELVEKYSNSHIFDFTIHYLMENHYEQPFDFFEDFSDYWEEKNLFNQSHSQKRLYEIFMDFWNSKNKEVEVVTEIVKFDYLLTHKGPLPNLFKENDRENKKERVFEFLKQPKNIKEFLPEFIDKSPKEVYKNVHFEDFSIDILDVLGLNRGEETSETNIVLFYFSKFPNGILNKAMYHRVEI